MYVYCGSFRNASEPFRKLQLHDSAEMGSLSRTMYHNSKPSKTAESSWLASGKSVTMRMIMQSRDDTGIMLRSRNTIRI